MSKEIVNHWVAETVDCPSATVPAFIYRLRGGESVTLKSLASSQHYHYIGADSHMSAVHAYKLGEGETMTIAVAIEFGRNNCIEIWCLPSNAGDDVCYFKAIDSAPVTEAST